MSRVQVADAVGALVGRADPAGLGSGGPRLPSRLRLDVQRAELVDADHDARVAGAWLSLPVGDRVQLEDPVLLGLELRVVRALPRSQRLKADAFLTQQLPQPLMGDVRHHLLGDQVVGQLGQAPGRKRLPEIRRDAQRDPLDLLALRKREPPRPTSLVARVQRVEPVPVEVMDHIPHRVGISEHHPSDPRRRHPLRSQQHNLGSPPGHNRAAAPTNHPEQPVALLVADLTQLHARRHCPLPVDNRSETALRRHRRGPSIETGKRCRLLH